MPTSHLPPWYYTDISSTLTSVHIPIQNLCTPFAISGSPPPLVAVRLHPYLHGGHFINRNMDLVCFTFVILLMFSAQCYYNTNSSSVQPQRAAHSVQRQYPHVGHDHDHAEDSINMRVVQVELDGFLSQEQQQLQRMWREAVDSVPGAILNPVHFDIKKHDKDTGCWVKIRGQARLKM
ncbi:hypothetical protein BX600DRAFT_477516, partial [Xylariales sp. PMI_506]